MALQIRYHRRIELWKNTLDSLNALLAGSHTLAALDNPLVAPFVEARADAARLHKRIARSLLVRMIPGGEAYLNWFAAYNIGRYWKTIRTVYGAREFLRACYLRSAALEADVSLARHLRSQPHWCWAERSGPRTLVLHGGVHPLMDAPSPLSMQLEGQGAFISGQNASGKSTFLRMAGLNLVAARAFGFCYAQEARLPALPVRASMQNEDSLLGGESLYMSELRRARELLDASGEPAGICLIDEVFRGTNHLESVSAAAAVLDSLCERDLVLVSTHNQVLARILAGKLEAFRIDTTGGRPVLEAGVLRDPNGIALLATQGFGARIEGRAAEVARWLSAQLAQPDSQELSCA
jgi:DNA mismatch repair ATPase MutS